MAVASPKKVGKPVNGSSSFAKKLIFFLLIFILPILLVIAMVGAALQFVGFPVLKTVESVVKPAHSVQKASALSQGKQEIATLQAKIRVLSTKDDTLSEQLATGQQGSQVLEAQIKQLKTQLAVQAKAEASAKIEGNVLVQMDTGPAAAVLETMTVQEAGLVVSTMAASDSGSILADLSAIKATQILAIAAEDEARTQASANTSSSASSNVSSTGT